LIRDRALEVVKRLGKTFGGFTPGQKAVTLIGIVAIVGGGFLFAKWAAKPDRLRSLVHPSTNGAGHPWPARSF